MKCLGLLAAAAATISSPGQGQVERLTDYPPTGVQLGNGWNSYTGAKTNDACVAAAVAADTGQHRWVSFSDIVDRSSLINSLSVSADAKVSSITGGGGSASVSFSRMVSLSTSNSNVGVNVWIIEGAEYAVPQSDLARVNTALATAAAQAASQGYTVPPSAQIAPVALNQGAIRLSRSPIDYERMARRSPLEFRSRCGDSFVSMVRRGSGIIGLASAATQTETEKNDFKASVQGSFGITQASASVASSMERMQSEDRFFLQYTQTGGAGSIIPTSLDKFKELVTTIGTQASPTTAAPYQIALTKYSAITRNADDRNSLMSDLADQYFRLDTIRRDLLDANANPDRYQLDAKVKPADIAPLETRVDRAMRAIEAEIARCGTKPNRCRFPRSVPRDDYEYRAAMPITKLAAAAWARHLAAHPAVVAATNALAAIAPTVRTGDHCVRFSFRVCQERSPDYGTNPAYTEAAAKLERAKQEEADYANAPTVDERRFQVLISDVNLARCDNHESACIDATRVEVLKTAMIH